MLLFPYYIHCSWHVRCNSYPLPQTARIPGRATPVSREIQLGPKIQFAITQEREKLFAIALSSAVAHFLRTRSVKQELDFSESNFDHFRAFEMTYFAHRFFFLLANRAIATLKSLFYDNEKESE